MQNEYEFDADSIDEKNRVSYKNLPHLNFPNRHIDVGFNIEVVFFTNFPIFTCCMYYDMVFFVTL